MKKKVVALLLAVSLTGLTASCIVSEKKLEDKVQEAIMEEVASTGQTLEVLEFDLNKEGKVRTGVLRGRVNGKEVVYDVSVTDDGDSFDAEWQLRE